MNPQFPTVREYVQGKRTDLYLVKRTHASSEDGYTPHVVAELQRKGFQPEVYVCTLDSWVLCGCSDHNILEGSQVRGLVKAAVFDLEKRRESWVSVIKWAQNNYITVISHISV